MISMNFHIELYKNSIQDMDKLLGNMIQVKIVLV